MKQRQVGRSGIFAPLILGIYLLSHVLMFVYLFILFILLKPEVAIQDHVETFYFVYVLFDLCFMTS